MSVVIETLVFCDHCAENGSGDSRSDSAKEIRAARKEAGWIQIGSKDYCEACAPLYRKNRATKNPLTHPSNPTTTR